jgi:hypothetical protein
MLERVTGRTAEDHNRGAKTKEKWSQEYVARKEASQVGHAVQVRAEGKREG